ncbi:prophage endopeptidase tail family protein [Staphylococcus auricularis]|uniref:prophage endopeptidase tail family protein n=1 Tax=Staphylococcus auricularis TaxID=29379 RepID=UPI002431C8F3|nr:prophage endopeptidase tail family protein [Staphylococcus auricularis]
MDNLVLVTRDEKIAEIINDFDFSSFKYDYEINNERSISFTAFKTNLNSDIFDRLVNENYILWKGQYYVIKSTELKYENAIITNDVEAKHISMEFQNHYVPKDVENESMNDDNDDKKAPSISLDAYLKYGFNRNKLDFDYKVHGSITKTSKAEELGDKTGMEHISTGAELFNYIYFADNKTFHIYTEDAFYEPSNEILVYKYNNSAVNVKTTTTDLKTYIEGYGKKKDKSETKNYSPIKPKDLNYSQPFIQEGTIKTQKVGASYSKELNCKWGNETLTWNLKKMSKGGMIEIFLDGKSKGEFSCYSKRSRTQKVIVAKGLKKGKHTFKAVFRGGKSGVDYKNDKPYMYVGTHKSTVLNLTAVLKGKDVYHTHATYKSDLYDEIGHMEAKTVYDDRIKKKKTLEKKLKQELNDKPTVEVETKYFGNEQIKENHTVRFIHKPLNFNTDVKVVKLTEHHPYTMKPVEVEFNNAKLDIVKLQHQIQTSVNGVTNRLNNQTVATEISDLESYSESVGSVLIDD